MVEQGRYGAEPAERSQQGQRDGEILGRVDELVAEEHELRARAAGHGFAAEDRARLQSIEEQLDQCWDLLRQRRARIDAGEDPNEAHVRPASEVEGYLQ